MRGATREKLTKATDINFDWVIYKAEQKQFEVKYNPGHMNLRD